MTPWVRYNSASESSKPVVGSFPMMCDFKEVLGDAGSLGFVFICSAPGKINCGKASASYLVEFTLTEI